MSGIIALIFLGVIIFIASLVYKHLYKYGLFKWMGRAGATIVTLGLTLLVLFWDVIPARISLNRLCESNGGQQIHQVVQANGYYEENDYSTGCDLGCMQRLGGYGTGIHFFYETNVNKPEIRNLSTEQGLYRFYLGKEGDPNCDLYNKSLMSGKIKHSSYVPGDSCVASEKINMPAAKYEFDRFKIINDISDIFNIRVARSVIRDRESGDIIAEANEYLYYGGWLVSWANNIVGAGNPLHCPVDEKFERPGLHTGILYKALKPIN